MSKYNRFITNFLIKNNNLNIHKILHNIYHKECNIIYSNIFRFNQYLSVNLVLDIPKSTDIALIDEKNLSHNYFLIEEKKNNEIKKSKKINLKIESADCPGLIHETIQHIELLDGKIDLIKSEIKDAPFNGGVYFSLNSKFNISSNISKKMIDNNFLYMRNKYDCEIKLE